MADLTQIPKPTVLGVLYNMLRGGLIGLAELIPGVSGGTIALITGVYERVLDSGNHVISAAKRLVAGPDRKVGAMEELRRVDWWLLIPMLLGMAAMVLSLAGVMEAFVTNTPTLSRGLFLGMVAASVAVPLLMVDWSTVNRRHWWLYGVLFMVAAVAAFLMTSSGGGRNIEHPSPFLIFGAAAIAICALALPGVSGSFFLLVIGLYATTMSAIKERDLAYIAIFGLGAITGLALFIRILHWLLDKHHTATMFAMSGLLLGSLRALWPWQTDGGDILAPGADAGIVLALAGGGAAIVAILVVVDRILSKDGASARGEQEIPAK